MTAATQKPPAAGDAATTSDAAAEIAAIEGRMAADREGYFADAGQRARYRALVAARTDASKVALPEGATDRGQGAADPATPTHLPGASAGGAALRALEEAWRRDGDFERRADRGAALLAALHAHLGAVEARMFASSVDALPDTVQAAFAAEAAMPGWGGRAASADPEVLRAFAETPAFAGLMRAWHNADSATTARKVAILNARLGRALARLKPSDRAAALDWWERLPGRTAAVLAWNLTAGAK